MAKNANNNNEDKNLRSENTGESIETVTEDSKKDTSKSETTNKDNTDNKASDKVPDNDDNPVCPGGEKCNHEGYEDIIKYNVIDRTKNLFKDITISFLEKLKENVNFRAYAEKRDYSIEIDKTNYKPQISIMANILNIYNMFNPKLTKREVKDLFETAHLELGNSVYHGVDRYEIAKYVAGISNLEVFRFKLGSEEHEAIDNLGLPYEVNLRISGFEGDYQNTDSFVIYKDIETNEFTMFGSKPFSEFDNVSGLDADDFAKGIKDKEFGPYGLLFLPKSFIEKTTEDPFEGLNEYETMALKKGFLTPEDLENGDTVVTLKSLMGMLVKLKTRHKL